MRGLLSGEWLKLMRQPSLLFWGFLSVPLLSILFKLLMEGLVLMRTGRHNDAPVDLFLSAAHAMGLSGNSMGHLLYAFGTASVLYWEYRFATWRLLVPRHARGRLLAAKFILCLGAISAGLAVAALGDMVLNAMLSIANGMGLAGVVVRLASLPLLAAAFAIALLELAVLTALAFVLVVATRSLMGAVIPTFLLAIGSSLLQVYLGSDSDGIPLPAYGAQALRDWLFSQASVEAGLLGLAMLAGWLAVLGTLMLVAFSRQQLSSE